MRVYWRVLRQGVVESTLHFCSHLAPSSDKNNILHAKLLHGNVHIYISVSMLWVRQRDAPPAGMAAVFWGFASSCSIFSSPTSQLDDSTSSFSHVQQWKIRAHGKSRVEPLNWLPTLQWDGCTATRVFQELQMAHLCCN